tara:strand:+ start:534 stop:737 length:204 start_codon:yes stop_codon:yes gene_type:complete
MPTKKKQLKSIKKKGCVAVVKETCCLDCKTREARSGLRTKKIFNVKEETYYKKNLKKSTHKDIFKNS